MDNRNILVVGGGAAGLIAAGRAAECGAPVVLLEKMNRPGRKLFITGKGRCNITNTAGADEFISRFGSTGRFLRRPFARFCNTDLMDLMGRMGLGLSVERGGRVFPSSGKSSDVLSALLVWIKRCGVQVSTSSPVDRLLIRDGRITGVVVRGRRQSCSAVILATGGSSYPATGSTGDGYRLAQSAGHSIVPVRPALVPLEAEGSPAGTMAGLGLRNIEASLFVNGKKRFEAFGEMAFSEFGVTGPVILRLSGRAVDALRARRRVHLCIDLKPALDAKKLDARIERDFTLRAAEPFRSVLRGLLPRQMVPVCATLTGIPPGRPAGKVGVKDRRRLRMWLKGFRFEITGHRPFSEAIITAGGVKTGEINPGTMESLVTGGLYIAGELLDVHADTGGYNLQAAFSTGWIAGTSAAMAHASCSRHAP